MAICCTLDEVETISDCCWVLSEYDGSRNIGFYHLYILINIQKHYHLLLWFACLYFLTQCFITFCRSQYYIAGTIFHCKTNHFIKYSDSSVVNFVSFFSFAHVDLFLSYNMFLNCCPFLFYLPNVGIFYSSTLFFNFLIVE